MPEADKSRPKDSWDRLAAIGSIATPIVAVLLGIYLPIALGAAQREADDRARDRQLDVAEVGARATKASVIPPLLDALLSADKTRQKMAISALLIALPEEGPGLVQQIQLAQSDGRTSVIEHARKALDARRGELIRDAFALDPTTREQAARNLATGWREDPKLAAALVQQAQQEPGNKAGAQAAVTILGSISAPALAKDSAAVRRFLDDADRRGLSTRQATGSVRLKLLPPKPVPGGAKQ
jgi:hypothetical protein